MRHITKRVSSVFYILFLATLISKPVAVISQDTIPEYGLMFSYQIEEGLAHGAIRNNSSAAYAYAKIGDYAKALSTYGLKTDLDLGTPLDYLPKDLHAVSAVDYIAAQAEYHEIIIISEAHQKPRHRVFTKSLLQKLYNQGYRHLGLEALPTFNVHPMFPLDSLVSSSGYPLVSDKIRGYTTEPNMVNLIRTAIDIGYDVFGYEKDGMKHDEMERDSAQASNIIDHMTTHPTGKYLIHCGWYHAIENDQLKRRSSRYMAYNLKKLTGKDPLTVYQDLLDEELSVEESPHYKNLSASESSIFFDKEGKPFMFYEDFDFFDLLVYHPRTSYRNQRPDWIYADNSKEFFVSGLNKDYLPAIIRAIPIDNKLDAAPIDIIEVKYVRDRKPLVLLPGKYKLLIKYDRGPDEIRIIEVEP